MSTRENFLSRLNSFESLEKEKKSLFDNISNIRLFVFLAGAALTITAFVKGSLLHGFSTLMLGLIIFVLLVIKHYRTENELKRVRCMVEINKRYLGRVDGDWVNLKDYSQEFLDPQHSYTGDLDIFGHKSLFQWICTANTYYGRRGLKSLLEAPSKDIELIKKRQNAVKELGEKLDYCQKLQCEGMLTPERGNNPESLLSYAEDTSKLFRGEGVQYLFYVLPAATILSFVLFFLKGPVPLYIPMALLASQMIICAVGYKKTSLILNGVYGFKENLGVFKNLFTLIEDEEFKDDYLIQLKSELSCKSMKASTQIKGLGRIADAIDLRYSAIMYFILNFGLLWDYHCVFALEDWKKLYGKSIRKWFQAVGEYEALASISVIKQINPEWAFPSISEKGLRISAISMGHPLISQDKRVCNDIHIENNSCVVTGSNMSGKTTLLRTIGINLVLAYCGAPVCANKLECSIMDIFTSMRINDDLSSGISTFYAELLRIKMIIDHTHKKQPMIFLIDEIFRGTNSKDRLIGAKSVLKNLNKSWIIGLISTHDFELCDLESEIHGRVKNYYFTEEYSNNEIKFDYKLRAGRCSTTNAKYLMRMVGIELTE
ncbi:MAG: DNA mismatch repair protein MutS [Clostridia bacterium]|nr:DNA mismatch repair protein MutS [Clostridia bacterium]